MFKVCSKLLYANWVLVIANLNSKFAKRTTFKKLKNSCVFPWGKSTLLGPLWMVSFPYNKWFTLFESATENYRNHTIGLISTKKQLFSWTTFHPQNICVDTNLGSHIKRISPGHPCFRRRWSSLPRSVSAFLHKTRNPNADLQFVICWGSLGLRFERL